MKISEFRFSVGSRMIIINIEVILTFDMSERCGIYERSMFVCCGGIEIDLDFIDVVLQGASL